MELGLGLGITLPRAAASGPAVTLTTGITAWWKLEDAADAVGSNTLTNTNTVTFVAAKVNNGANLVGASSQKLACPNTTSINHSAGSFTTAGWYRPSTVSGFYGILAKTGDNGSSEWALNQSSANLIFQTFDVPARATVQCVSAISASTWHFVLLSFDYATMTQTLRINNGTAATTVATSGPKAGTGPFSIGATTGGLSLPTAVYDEWFYIKRLLTQDEQDYLYNSGSGRTWPLA